jgi:hypothetical protein
LFDLLCFFEGTEYLVYEAALVSGPANDYPAILPVFKDFAFIDDGVDVIRVKQEEHEYLQICLPDAL